MAGSILSYEGMNTPMAAELALTLKKQVHLTKILFTKGHCLCHDINIVTKSSSHIDLIMGFSTGEIIWYEPITQKYTRLNKNVCRKGTNNRIHC